MTDKERLDHAIVVFMLLNEKLLADICKSIKEYRNSFYIDKNELYAEYTTKLIRIVQQSNDKEKRTKISYYPDEEGRNHISFKLPHIPE